MPRQIQDMSTWGASSGTTQTRASSLDAPSTMTANELWPSKSTDIGKRVAETHWELPVVCEPADAMRLQFDLQHRPHASLHDLCGRTSRRLISGLAAAMQTHTQSLSILRQGYGNKLATLQFVELPTSDATTKAKNTLRVYSTALDDADERGNKRMADVLLSTALLSVLMIPADATANQLGTGLVALREAMTHSDFTCRMVLLMPLAPTPGLEAKVYRFPGGRQVDVRVAPTIVRPVDAWNHLRTAWNEVTKQAADDGDSSLMLLPDPTAPNAVAERSAMPIKGTGADHVSATATQDVVEALRRRLLAENDAEKAQHAKLAATRARQRAEQQAIKEQAEVEAKAAALRLQLEAANAGVLLEPSAAGDGFGAPGQPRSHAAPTTPSLTAASAASAGKLELPPIDFSGFEVLHADTVVAPAVPVAPKVTVATVATVAPVTAVAPQATASAMALQDLVQQCSEIKGFVSVSIVDTAKRTLVASAGVQDATTYADNGTRLVNATRAAAMALQLPTSVPDMIMTLDRHHVLVMPLPGHDKHAVLAVFDKTAINGVVAQLKLQRLGQELALG